MGRLLFFLCLAALLIPSLNGREWKSADGSRSLHASFAALKDQQVLLRLPDGKTTVLPLTALAADDAEFARLAQASMQDAQALGPQTLQVQTGLEDGWIARLGTRAPGKDSPWIFAGETIYLLRGKQSLEPGDILEAQTLFPAGQRTYLPLDSDATVIRAFALELEEAATAAFNVRQAAGADTTKLAPQVVEPLVQTVSIHGLALPLGKGYYLIERSLLKNATTLMLHENAKDFPLNVVKEDAALDLVLVSCPHEMEPVRLIPRQPAQIGQSVFAVSIPLTSTRKNLGPPTLTRGIVSKTGTGASFEHDAVIAPEAIGGYLLSERWEVLGVFFRSRSRVEKAPASPRSSSPEAQPEPALPQVLHSRFLEQILLVGEKGSQRRLPGVPAPRSGSLGDAPKPVIDLLRASTALVIATREEKRDPPARKPTAVSPAAAAGDGSAQFSLSSSGIRHNTKCRYFNAAKACQATDGHPCKLCGG
jgi:hypothetical protein